MELPLLVLLAFVVMPAIFPLLMDTPRRLLICDAMLGSAILAFWNWAGVQVEGDVGSGAGSGFAAMAAIALPTVAAAALAVGSLVRGLAFYFSEHRASTSGPRKAGFDSAWLLLLLVPLAFAPRIVGALPARYDWRDFRGVPYTLRGAMEIGHSPRRPWRTTTTLALICTEPGELRLLERIGSPYLTRLQPPFADEAYVSLRHDLSQSLQLPATLVATGPANTIVTAPLPRLEAEQFAHSVGSTAWQEIYVGFAEGGGFTRSIADEDEMRQFAAACHPRRVGPPIGLQPASRPLV